MLGLEKMKLEKDIAVWESIIPITICENIIEHFELTTQMGAVYPRRSQLVTDTQLFHTELDSMRMSPSKGHLEPFWQTFWHCWQQYADHYGVLNCESELAVRSVKTQKTLPTQGFHQWHWEADSLEHASRVAAFTLYLNTVEGGETEFIQQSMRIPAIQGSLSIFPAAFTHAHRGNPPLNTAKYILTGWVEF